MRGWLARIKRRLFVSFTEKVHPTLGRVNLVTGATGMLGTHILFELLQNGEPVRALKRTGSDLGIVKKVLDFYKPGKNLFEKIQWIEGDIMEIESLLSAMEGVDHVYHSAAVVSYHKKDREMMYRINVHGTANVVNAAMKTGVKKLCHVSSIAALGKISPDTWINENAEWKDSSYNTHYAISKHASEMEAWRGVQEGLPAIIVNPALIIGPGDFSRSSASIFRKLDEGLGYYPPGGTGFVGAKDCARAMYRLMKSDIINEGYLLVGENESMQFLFTEISKKLGRKAPVKQASPFIMQIARIGEWLKELFTGRKALVTKETVRNASLRFYYDNRKIKEALQFEFTSVEVAVDETSRFYLQENPR